MDGALIREEEVRYVVKQTWGESVGESEREFYLANISNYLNIDWITLNKNERVFFMNSFQKNDIAIDLFFPP